MSRTFVSPVAVYAVWHPSFDKGKELGRLLFQQLCRNSESLLEHRLGIPVYYRSAPNDKMPLPIPFEQSERTLVVCLVDDLMVMDSGFRTYVARLYADCVRQKCRFLPVACSKNAFQINKDLAALNFVRCYERSDYEPLFLQSVLHELCKSFQETMEPVKLFISHSKHDQVLQDATAFRDYVNQHAQVKTFFDANDIGYGDQFAKVLEENAGKCVVVAFVSDTYSSREWCRNEIIIAKKNACPILVVHAFSKGEARSFPYLGNLTTRQWEKQHEPILNLALHVALANYFNKAALQMQSAFYGLQADVVLASYPELFTIIRMKKELAESGKQAGIVIYPDPPLGNEELELLNEMSDHLSFITPLQLSTLVKYGRD
jgi:hypothetical protein